MKYLSVCSGIEAATAAWHPLGWEPVAFSEIEKFPSAVLKHHYPYVPNWGDMTKFKEWPDATINVLVGGTPCQSFSVAGLRKGLDDPRGNLMLTYLAIADRYRPEWLVWENVPGVLSSNGGRDFGTFLGGLGELGYGFAYRVLDAQYFGVAQRRRRVFVVANARDWRRAAAVLFERESLSGNPAPSREARQGVAGTIAARFGSSRNNQEELTIGWDEELNASVEQVGTLLRGGDGGRRDGVMYPASGSHWDDPVNPHPTLNQSHNTGGIAASDQELFSQRGSGLVAQPVATFAKTHKPMSATDAEGWSPVDAAPTVTHWPRDRSDAGTDVAVVQPVIAWDEELNASIEVAGTLLRGGAGGRHDGVMQPVGTDCYNGAITGEVAATIGTPGSSVNASGPTVMQPVGSFKPGQSAAARSIGYEAEVAPALEGGGGGNNKPAVHVAMQVRRLTPVECERLQGFPDGYTNIPWRGKPESPDGPRYKALGNSMAVPCMAWIGERIQQVNDL